QGGELAPVARGRGHGPCPHLRRGVVEGAHEAWGERRGGDYARVRRQRRARARVSDACPRAEVRDQEAVAADALELAAPAHEAVAAGTEDEHAAIATLVSADRSEERRV